MYNGGKTTPEKDVLTDDEIESVYYQGAFWVPSFGSRGPATFDYQSFARTIEERIREKI